MKVQLEGVAETLLIPLWARAHETQKNKNSHDNLLFSYYRLFQIF